MLFEEKEVLIKEIHHRVKNNLGGYLRICSNYSRDNANNGFATRVLSESQRRVQSISMIHEKLYQSERLAEIDFEKYVRELIDVIAYSFSYPNKEITVNIEIDNFKVGVDQGIPCGLILNELVSNAYEHAFKNKQQGIITIEITEADDQITMIVADNGTVVARMISQTAASR
ncbi:MAG: sensor histidine kinase [Fodinibius sp.]|nr:sensor histidine kinase [Fodinibius sp.]